MHTFVAVEDEAFAAFAAESGLVTAPVVENDDFIRPMLHALGRRLAEFRPSALPDCPLKGVRLGLIEKVSPNAFVECWGDYVVIAIHTGLLLSLLEATVQLQDEVGMFETAFGMQTADKIPVSMSTPLGLTSYIRHRLGLPHDDDAIHQVNSPDALASRRALRFMSAGIQFACLHEFGHLACGHLAWLKDQRRAQQLFEIGEDKSYSVSDELFLSRRFFEHEADVFALETLIRSAMTRPPDLVTTTNQTDEIMTIMLGFLFVAFTWIEVDKTIGSSPNGYHPAPSDRLFGLPIALTGLLEESDQFQAPLAEALKRCRGLLTRVITRCPEFRDIGKVFDPNEVARVDGLIEWMRQMDRKTATRTAR